jgi:hypothetical protein
MRYFFVEYDRLIHIFLNYNQKTILLNPILLLSPLSFLRTMLSDIWLLKLTRIYRPSSCSKIILIVLLPKMKMKNYHIGLYGLRGE